MAGRIAGIFSFAVRCKNVGMSADDFAKIADNITTANPTNVPYFTQPREHQHRQRWMC